MSLQLHDYNAYFITGIVLTYRVCKKANGLSRGLWSSTLLHGLPEYGVRDDWTSNDVMQRVANTTHAQRSTSSWKKYTTLWSMHCKRFIAYIL